MRGSELLDKMELASPAYVAHADRLPQKSRWQRWLPAAACLALLLVVGLSQLSAIWGSRGSPGQSDPLRPEGAIEWNGAYYRIVGLADTQTLSEYNLPQKITADMVGENLGRGFDDAGAQSAEVFYQYAPYADISAGEQQRAQRAVYLVSQDAGYAFALFCGFVHFDTNTYQEAGELFAVYGVDGAEDLAAATVGEEGVSDPDEIAALFSSIESAAAFGHDDYEEAVSELLPQSGRQESATQPEGGVSLGFVTDGGLVISGLHYDPATGFLCWAGNYYKLSTPI